MKAFVIHAATLKERGEHMDRMLRSIGMDYEFISEGDADQLTNELLDKYLKNSNKPDNIRNKLPQASCAIKHFLAYEHIVARNIEGILIFEDDIILHDNFLPCFEQSMKEYRKNYAEKSILISYEDSTLRFVPRSRREKGRVLYPAKNGRTTGCYFVNRTAAKAILDQIRNERCDRPIDWYHNLLFDKGIVECLWCQPAIATQGSFTGTFQSSLFAKHMNTIKFRWWFKKSYKRLLYWFR